MFWSRDQLRTYSFYLRKRYRFENPNILLEMWPTHPRHFGNQVTVRPSASQAHQCKVTQSTGMATQMQLEVIL